MSFTNKCSQIFGEMDVFICKCHGDFGILRKNRKLFPKVEPMKLSAVAYLRIFGLEVVMIISTLVGSTRNCPTVLEARSISSSLISFLYANLL